jgi:bla regulator protein BlaR1
MTGAWSNDLWQSTWFAIAVGLLTMVFRKNRAQVRYWLGLSASIKFLLPFSMLMSLGSHLNWAPTARKISAPAAWFAMTQISGPFPVSSQPALPMRGSTDWISILVAEVWACGFAGVALIRLRGWLRIRAAVRSSARIELPVAMEVRSGAGGNPA